MALNCAKDINQLADVHSKYCSDHGSFNDCEGPDGHPTLFGMWRLDWVVKCGRTAHEMVVVIKYIYTHLFTKGSSSPRHVPKHKTNNTYRPYSQVLQYSAPWAHACLITGTCSAQARAQT